MHPAKKPKKFSRRDFILKTAFFAAGSVFGGNRFLTPLARAMSAGPAQSGSLAAEKPQISIIIDDVGYNQSRVFPFLDLKVPITFSILPRVTYSRRLAEIIHGEGHEIMLHQPMEPSNPLISPGPGALYLNLHSEEMQPIIAENIAGVPYAIGANNHMGSLFTESRDKTAEALTLLKNRNLFFVDSFTTSNSIAFETARQLHMTTAFRNIFIDNHLDNNYICSQLRKLKTHALKFGHAIGIGHPRPETLAVLADFFDDLKGSGFSFVYASQIVHT